MSERQRAFLSAAGAFLALLLWGCERTDVPAQRPPEAAEADRGTSFPPLNVTFLLVPPDGEKKSGLYAVRFLEGVERYYPGEFKTAADGKADPLLPGPQHVTLVGKLPGKVRHLDFFEAQEGSMKGGEIEMRARFVEYTGAVDARLAPREVYVVVHTPVLKAGKYRARITFEDWEYRDARDKTNVLRDAAGPPSRFAPLVCEFEITAEDNAGQ